MLEELNSHVDGHIEHIVDALTLILHLQRLAVVAVTTTLAAAYIDIGQEVHLYGLVTRTAACLASSTLNIEREATRLIASNLRIGCLLEELANIGKDISICCWVTAWSATNGRLVHNNNLIDMLQALDGCVGQRLVEGAI